MKTSVLSLLFLSFFISNLHASFNPWDIEKLSVNQIIELNDLQFDMDEADITETSMQSLHELKTFLRNNKSVKIELRGHTNTIPPAEYCNELSTKRAHTVKEYLVEAGVDAERIVATGYGKELPRNAGLTPAERKSNQRVEVKILAL